MTLFTVSMPEPATHLFQVGMGVPPFASAPGAFELVLPVWTPGSYAVRDHARHLRDLVVVGPEGATLPVAKVGKSRWRVEAGTSAGPFTVRYRVWANELTVRTAHLDTTHGHGNGACLFLYVEGRKDEPQALRFVLPDGWKASIALPEKDGMYLAADYDELVDSPFECGTHRTFDFEVRGVPHTLALWGSGNEEPARLVADLARLVEEVARFFGGLPYERYLFLVHVAAGAHGGLEHRASQTCGLSPDSFRPASAYRETLLLFSHELFHAWNVKRIRPAVLGPFDYTSEVPTRDLWALEGLTSYYEGLLLARARLVEPKHVLAEWAKALKGHEETPGRCVQSAEEASFDAWIRLYRPDENSPNVSESYYRRGQLIGLALDLTLRMGGRGSLDDVVRLLWERHGKREVPYPDGAWETAAREVGGEGVAAFFDSFVRGHDTPDLGSLLRAAGLVLVEKPEKDGDEGESATEVPVRADFGWRTKAAGGRVEVTGSLEGRPAHAAGIGAGDEVVAVDGARADEAELKRVERERSPGSRVTVHLFRRGRLVEVPLVLGSRRAFTYEIRPDPAAPPEARALHEAWLGVPFPETKAP